MDITESKPNQRPWKIEGRSITYVHAQGHGQYTITIQPGGRVKIEAGGLTAVLTVEMVLSLQAQETLQFLRDPAVAPFLYASSERESRMRAARMIAQRKLSQHRREYVAVLLENKICTEDEAWGYARLKYP